MSSHENTSGTKKQNQRPGVFPNLSPLRVSWWKSGPRSYGWGFFWGQQKSNEMRHGFSGALFFGITLSWTPKTKKLLTSLDAKKKYTRRLYFFKWIRYLVGKSIVSCGIDSGGGGGWPWHLPSRISMGLFFGWFFCDGLFENTSVMNL